MKLIIAALGLALAAAPVTETPEPTAPRYEWGACPFEGCVYRTWVATRDTAAFAEPRADAPAVFQIKPGDSVRAITGVVITATLGHVQVTAPVSLSYGSFTLTVAPGDPVYVLRYIAEGTYLVWAKGRTFHYNGDFDRLGPVQTRPELTVMTLCKTEWWAKVRNRQGQVGWCLNPRSFKGNDSLG